MLLAACGDAVLPDVGTVPTEELLILRQQPGTPAPTGLSFYASNARLTVRTIRHPDAANTAYLEIRVPPGTLASLDGRPLGPADSVLLTVEPRPGAYGFSVSPSGVAFTLSSTPTAGVTFARYADLSVADGSARYATRNDYAAALTVWQEVGLGRWRPAKGAATTPSGVDAAIDEPGLYVVAARR